MSKGTQHAGLADAGFAHEQRVSVVAAGLDKTVDRAAARSRYPQVGIADLFAERCLTQTPLR
jgi:hypothetical protein